MQQISQRGIDLLKQLEGCELSTYFCSGGILSVGYGSTGSHVKNGMVITEQEAEDLLKKDLERFEEAVNRLVKVKITQGQYDSLVIFSFNIGIGAFANSTLLKLLNRGLHHDAGRELSRWSKVNGLSLAGLRNRRRSELTLYSSQPYIEA